MHGDSHGRPLDDDIELIGLGEGRPPAMETTNILQDNGKQRDEGHDGGESEDEFFGDESEEALLTGTGPQASVHHHPPTTRIQRGLDVFRQVQGIVVESAPTLLLTTVSLLFSGKLLDQVARWRAMREVDQLIMIIPAVLNLQGNLQMNLSARLSTAANIGELEDSAVRRSMLLGNLSLLQVQAITISFVASCMSLLLSPLIPRPPTEPAPSSQSPSAVVRQIIVEVLDPRKPIPHLPPQDSATSNPRLTTLFMVSATAMTSAFLSGLILGSFMCALVLVCRRFRLDPDNIAPAVASCLGDLITLITIGGVSAALIPFLHTVIPFLVVIMIIVAGVCCLVYTLRNEQVAELIKEGWSPLVGAMIISSGTGIVLDVFVSKYEGFAVLAVVISGLPGATGSIFVSRLSTSLHAAAFSIAHPVTSQRSAYQTLSISQSPASHHRSASQASATSRIIKEPSPGLVMLTLLLINIPVEIIFLAILNALGWLDLPFLFVTFSIVFFCVAVLASLIIARALTNWLWSHNRDPDIYALPVHSATMDLIGQLLLVLCFEISSRLGAKIKMRVH